MSGPRTRMRVRVVGNVLAPAPVRTRTSELRTRTRMRVRVARGAAPVRTRTIPQTAESQATPLGPAYG